MRHILNVLTTLTLTLLSWGTVCLALSHWGVLSLLNIPIRGTVLTGMTIDVLGAFTYWFMSKDIAGWSLNLRDLAAEDLSTAACPGITADLARFAAEAGLKTTPQLLVFSAPEVTALAVGWRPRNTVIAVSTGLLRQLPGAETGVILQQTLAKIANGDISALLLTQAFVNVFSLFPARVFAAQMGTSLRTSEEDTPSDAPERLTIGVLETLLVPWPALFVRHLARAADLRADRTTANRCGAAPMRQLFATLSRGSAPSAFRERFTESVKFGALARSALLILSFHVPYEARMARVPS